MREVNVAQEYGYINRIKQGSFETSDWSDYWNTHGAGGPARVSKSDTEFAIQLSSGSTTTWNSTDAGIDYAETIHVDSGWQGLIKFKFRVDWTGTPTTIRANFVVWFDADSGAGNDLYLDQQGNWLTSWYAMGVYADLNNNGKWIDVEALTASGGITEAGILKIYCNKAIRIGGTAVTNTYYTGISVKAADDSDVRLPLTEELSLELTDNGINSREREVVKLGDASLLMNYAEEWQLGALGNVSGATAWTTTWRAYIGSTRTAYGKAQGLIEHFRDWLANVLSRPMHKFTGQMSAGRMYPWYGFTVPNDEDPFGDDRLFVIGTVMTNCIQCISDIELLELPRDSVRYGVEHSDNWTNSGINGFTTFTETAGVIDLTGTVTQFATCDDNITIVTGEILEVIIKFTSGSGTLRLSIGSVNLDFSTEQTARVTTSGSGSQSISLTAQGTVSYTDLEIEIYRTAGY